MMDLAVCFISYDNTVLRKVSAEIWEHGGCHSVKGIMSKNH